MEHINRDSQQNIQEITGFNSTLDEQINSILKSTWDEDLFQWTINHISQEIENNLKYSKSIDPKIFWWEKKKKTMTNRLKSFKDTIDSIKEVKSKRMPQWASEQDEGRGRKAKLQWLHSKNTKKKLKTIWLNHEDYITMILNDLINNKTWLTSKNYHNHEK